LGQFRVYHRAEEPHEARVCAVDSVVGELLVE